MARSTRFIDVATHIQNTGNFPDDLSDRDRDVYNAVAQKINSGETVVDGFEEMTLTKLSKVVTPQTNNPEPEPEPEAAEPEPEETESEPEPEPEDMESPVLPREVIAEKDSDIPMSVPRGILGIVNKPPENLPAFPIPTVSRGTPVLGNRNKQNELGLSVDKESDTCHHLNASWKGGVCMLKGNAPCPYLGGHQHECGDFVEKSDVPPVRRRNRPL